MADCLYSFESLYQITILNASFCRSLPKINSKFESKTRGQTLLQIEQNALSTVEDPVPLPLLNISIIGSVVELSGVAPSPGFHPVYALVIGAPPGGAARLAFQTPMLKSAGLLVRPGLDFRCDGLIRILKMTGPMIPGAAAYQVEIYISNSLAWPLVVQLNISEILK